MELELEMELGQKQPLQTQDRAATETLKKTAPGALALQAGVQTLAAVESAQLKCTHPRTGGAQCRPSPTWCTRLQQQRLTLRTNSLCRGVAWCVAAQQPLTPPLEPRCGTTTTQWRRWVHGCYSRGRRRDPTTAQRLHQSLHRRSRLLPGAAPLRVSLLLIEAPGLTTCAQHGPAPVQAGERPGGRRGGWSPPWRCRCLARRPPWRLTASAAP